MVYTYMYGSLGSLWEASDAKSVPLYSFIFILRVHSNSNSNDSAVHVRAYTHAGIYTYYIRAGRVRAEYCRLGDDLVKL
jgi:hypothetical protein